MKRLLVLTVLCSLVILPSTVFAFPSVYPTGTTIYKPEKCWNGYTMLMSYPGALLIDMNGNEVKKWNDDGAGPNRILPGGYLMKPMRAAGKGKGVTSLVQMDWDGNIVWEFNRFEQVSSGPPGGNRGGGKGGAPGSAKGKGKGGPPSGQVWTAGIHHDWQREGSPAGYYAPGLDPLVDRGKTLVLAKTTVSNPKINSNPLADDVFYEVSWDGKIIWKWLPNEHVDEMGFDEEAFKVMQSRREPRLDWFHANCVSWLGPNKWYDAGDERFHPDNIIIDSRTSNILAIVDRKTDKIVWQVGPRYDTSPQLKKLGWIIGPHNVHMIPKGLPGAGNILVFDNGGAFGYGKGSPNSRWLAHRDYSRTIEFDPITLEIVWEFSGPARGMEYHDRIREYSPYQSGAQRLPNGNTLIAYSTTGRAIEVTRDLEIVWEYITPHYKLGRGGPPGTPPPRLPNLQLYRAYRVPYEWIPQLKKPKEVAVIPPHNKDFKIKNAEGN